jgi:hypothetical protein
MICAKFAASQAAVDDGFKELEFLFLHDLQAEAIGVDVGRTGCEYRARAGASAGLVFPWIDIGFNR